MPRHVDLASVDLIVRVAERAMTELDWRPENDAEAEMDRETGRFPAAVEALRFAIAAAGLLREPRILPAILRAVPFASDRYRGLSDEDGDTLAAGIKRLLRQIRSMTPDVRRMARSRDPAVRLAVAGALRPLDPDAIALLTELARDPAPAVRAAAASSLGSPHAPPWWWGVFPKDPLADRPADEVARLREPLARTTELLRLGSFEIRDRLAELRTGLAELPDDLARQGLECFFRREDWAYLHRHTGLELATLLVERDPQDEVALRLFRHWASRPRGSGYAGLFGEALTGSSAAVRERLCRRALGLLPDEDDEDDSDRWYQMGSAVSDLFKTLWPPEADPTFLFERLLGGPLDRPLEEETRKPHDIGALGAAVRRDPNYWLRGLVEHERVDILRVLDPVLAAFERGFPPPWDCIDYKLRNRLAGLRDPRVRAVAERMLTGTSESAGWALSYLVGAGHDPSRDPAPTDIIRRAFDDPRLRPVVFHAPDLLVRVLPAARTALRAGAVTADEARWIVETLRALWGPTLYVPADEKSLCDRRAKVAELVAPDPLPGPLDEEEWAAVRALLRTGGDPANRQDRLDFSLLYLPPGPWHPADRAFFDKLVAEWRAGHDRWEDHFLLEAIRQKPAAEDLPLLDEILEARRRAGEHADDLAEVRERRAGLRAALGLAEAPAAQAASRSDDWLDEPDDGEED